VTHCGRLSFSLAATIAAAGAQTAFAQADLQLSGRIQQWSGDRLNRPDHATANLELWGKIKLPVGESVTVRGEGWAGLDPRGTGAANGDLREGLIEIRVGPATIQAGRQLFAWGRADRVNPTDVLVARDYRRLVVDEDENRLGEAALSLSIPLAEGRLTGHWVPEFRASVLPQDIAATGLAVIKEPPADKSSYAVRYERFGGAIDFALTAADLPDRLPWLSIDISATTPTLKLRHPRVRMVGVDLATTLADFGVRVEMARYFHTRSSLQDLSPRMPLFAATIGVDRSFRGQWLVIAQAIIRHASDAQHVAVRQRLLADRNAVIHGVWRETIVGATLSVRKTFAANRGNAELTGAVLSGGGRFLQARASFAISGTMTVQILAENFFGPTASYFGRQSANNNVMAGLRVGF
jgi:hypothetical protein